METVAKMTHNTELADLLLSQGRPWFVVYPDERTGLDWAYLIAWCALVVEFKVLFN